MNSLISIPNVRANLPHLVSKVNGTLDRVVITVKRQPKAVLLSAEELESLEETAEVLSISGAKKSIQQGLKEAKKSQGTSLSQLK